MNIGEPRREIVVEPLELPEPIRDEPEPIWPEGPEPQEEPVHVS